MTLLRFQLTLLCIGLLSLLLAIAGQGFPGTIYESTVGPAFAIVFLLTLLAYIPGKWIVLRRIEGGGAKAETPLAGPIGEGQPPELEDDQAFALLVGRPATRIVLFSTAALIMGLLQGMGGSWTRDAVFLVAGGPVAVAGLFFFRTSMPSVVAPYVLGCYLVFFPGLSQGWRLLTDATATVEPVGVVVSLYVGYRLVYWAHQLSELYVARSRGGSPAAATEGGGG